MKIAPALRGTTLTSAAICALAGTPWVLLAMVIVVLAAVHVFVHSYVGWSKTRREALLELIRTLHGR